MVGCADWPNDGSADEDRLPFRFRVSNPTRQVTPVYFGLLIFIALAVLCVFAFIKVKKQDKRYGEGE